jgi:Activator of Hsp90 ATPase homolog 1-like protein
MSNVNFTTSFAVDRTPDEVFAAINDVRGWWEGDIEGRTDALGEEFTYRHKDIHYSKQKITELIPGAKVVWRVVDARLSFTSDPAEWTGTEITFAISEQDGKTEVRFTHMGLVPEFECFDDCSNAWGYYINGSLRNVIAAGQTHHEVTSPER